MPSRCVCVCSACLTLRAVVNVVLAQISAESRVTAALKSSTLVLTHSSVSAWIPHTLVNIHLTRLTCSETTAVMMKIMTCREHEISGGWPIEGARAPPSLNHTLNNYYIHYLNVYLYDILENLLWKIHVFTITIWPLCLSARTQEAGLCRI